MNKPKQGHVAYKTENGNLVIYSHNGDHAGHKDIDLWKMVWLDDYSEGKAHWLYDEINHLTQFKLTLTTI